MAKKIKRRDVSGSKIHRSGHDGAMFQAKTAKNTDVIRVSDGKVLAPDETVQLADGNEFVTRPKRSFNEILRGNAEETLANATPPQIASVLAERDTSKRQSLRDVQSWVRAADDAQARGDEETRIGAARLGRAERLMPGYTRIILPLMNEHRAGGYVQVRLDDGMQALATWLWFQQCMRNILAGVEGFGRAFSSPNRRFVRDDDEMTKSRDELARSMERARVIAFDCDDLLRTIHSIDDACSRAAGLTAKDIEAAAKIPRDEREREPEVWERWWKVAKHNVPAQIATPFPVVALVYGCGATMPDDDVINLARSWDGSVGQMGCYLAHVVDTETGNAWQIASCEEPDLRSAIHLTRVQRDGEWVQAACTSLQPHAIAALLSSARNYQGKPIEATHIRQRQIDSTRVDGIVGTIPPPFYIVKQRPVAPTMKKPPRDPRPHVPPSYRFDVRSHDRVFIHRGPAPLEPAIEKRLLKRGYRIFAERWPEGLAEACRARGHEDPKRGEWLAVRVVGVKAHLKGPDGAEYVPSLRVPTGGDDVAVVNDAEPSSSANGSASDADG